MSLTPLEEIGEPLYFIAEDATAAGFPVPPNPHGQSLRTWVRSLGGMQKEALVVSAATGTAWRFACDEGAHLGGHAVQLGQAHVHLPDAEVVVARRHQAVRPRAAPPHRQPRVVEGR